MIYSPHLEEIRADLFDTRIKIENFTGIAGTGITHGIISGIGNDYHLLVYLKDPSAISLIPSSVYEIPVSYMITGEIRTQILAFPSNVASGCTGTPTSCTCTGITGAFRSKYRPLQSGGSVGNVNIRQAGYCDAGTLGGFPRLPDGTQVILSNNHVLAHDTPWNRLAKEGDAIIQPGTLDNGDSNVDTVSNLKKWLSIPNKSTGQTMEVDGAISGPIDSGISVNPNGLCNYPTNYTVPPVIGMKIKKSGRTTGCTTGIIQAIDVTSEVNYCPSSSCPAKFVGQIQTSGNFSDSGDSGSVVVTDDGNNNAVGLLFAGGSGGISILNVMSKVEAALGVSFGAGPSCAQKQPICNFDISI